MDKPKVWIWLQRANGKRQKTYICQWVDPETNKVKSKSCGKDRTKAEAFKVDKVRDLEQGISRDVRRQEWQPFVDEYLADLRVLVDARDKAEATHTEALLTLRKFKQVCNPRWTFDVNYAMCKRFKVARMGAGIKNSTINKNLMTLHGVFNWAVKMERMASNPLSKSDLYLKAPKGVGRACSDDEVKALLDSCQEDRWLAFCLIGVRAGFRSGEIRNLEWDDVDFDNDMLHLRVKKDWKPKSGRERSVPMNPQVREVLLRLQPNRFKSSYVILNKLGRRLQYNVKWGFGQIVQRAGLVDNDNPITPHALRRTFGTTLANKNTPPKILMELMGHANISTTMDYYVQANDDLKREAVKTA